METWQIITSICAGVITIVTFLDKIGVIKKVKKTEAEFAELKDMLSQFLKIQEDVSLLNELQSKQNQALLSILRNELYTCFKENRDVGVWTDDECSVQTKIHEAYKALHGNGEEDLWWQKKQLWDIVPNDEYNKMFRMNNI